MDEMTNGEIARALARLEKSQDEQMVKLDEIKEQTTKTNGHVARHEDKLFAHDREIRDLRRLRGHKLERQSDRSDVITLQIPAAAISPKMVALVVSAIASGLWAAWKAGLFS